MFNGKIHYFYGHVQSLFVWHNQRVTIRTSHGILSLTGLPPPPKIGRPGHPGPGRPGRVFGSSRWTDWENLHRKPRGFYMFLPSKIGGSGWKIVHHHRILWSNLVLKQENIWQNVIIMLNWDHKLWHDCLFTWKERDLKAKDPYATYIGTQPHYIAT